MFQVFLGWTVDRLNLPMLLLILKSLGKLIIWQIQSKTVPLLKRTWWDLQWSETTATVLLDPWGTKRQLTLNYGGIKMCSHQRSQIISMMSHLNNQSVQLCSYWWRCWSQFGTFHNVNKTVLLETREPELTAVAGGMNEQGAAGKNSKPFRNASAADGIMLS